ETFPFEATLTAEPVALDQPAGPPALVPVPKWLEKLMAQKHGILIAAIGASTILLLIGGVFFLLGRSRKKKPVRMTEEIAGNPPKAIAATTQKAQNEVEARMAEHAAEHARKEAEAILALQVPTVSTKKTDVLTKHIATEAKKDPTAMAHVVRNWLNGEYQ